jgi:hypothetical protein
MRAGFLTTSMLVLLSAAAARAEPIGYPQWREEFRDGACLIKRSQDRHGGYKEEIRCDAPPGLVVPVLSEEFIEGRCRIVRKQEANGQSFFGRDCKAPT